MYRIHKFLLIHSLQLIGIIETHLSLKLYNDIDSGTLPMLITAQSRRYHLVYLLIENVTTSVLTVNSLYWKFCITGRSIMFEFRMSYFFKHGNSLVDEHKFWRKVACRLFFYLKLKFFVHRENRITTKTFSGDIFLRFKKFTLFAKLRCSSSKCFWEESATFEYCKSLVRWIYIFIWNRYVPLRTYK